MKNIRNNILEIVRETATNLRNQSNTRFFLNDKRNIYKSKGANFETLIFSPLR